ncbi:hypothetical protein ACL02T_18865 [Pseudonocardia sp. RS010]|uniref:hypothetical protein n=1 Tax=Pseudonocardia sp. RS010 TaxID=3385979 RepID=UPI0039A261C0
MDARGVLRRRMPWVLWAIPVVALLAALVLLLKGAPTAAAVVAAAALLMVGPIRRLTVGHLPVELTADEVEELRRVALCEGELAAVRRLRELRPATGIGAAVRTVRGL